MRIFLRWHTWFRAPGPSWTRSSGESQGSNIYCTNTTPTSGGYIRSTRRSFNKPVTGRTFNSRAKTSGGLTICIGKPEIPAGKSNESRHSVYWEASENMGLACEKENGRARGRHARDATSFLRVSPSRAPVFSCVHYFQAPATQANMGCDLRGSNFSTFFSLFNWFKYTCCS